MADQTQNANVVLTADTSGYTAGVQQAQKDTSLLAASVDKLSQSLDGITKRAGKKLMLFGAADLAAMGAMTAQAAAFQKQLSGLSAITANSGQNMTKLKDGIEELAKEFPVSKAEAAALATELMKLGITTEQTVTKMSETFVKMGGATGESMNTLAQQMVELGRTMGTLSSGNYGMERYANTVVKLSQGAGVAATSILSFSQAIAPLGRLAGMSEKEVLGVSTAFARAGQDGYLAANTFNSMIADITRNIQYGSPEVAKYAKTVGMTVESFKKLSTSDQVIELFEAINEEGGSAIRTLDLLGYDGARAAKSIAAVAQSGGLRKAISEAMGTGDGTKQLDTSSAAAFDNLVDKLDSLKESFAQLGLMIGTTFLKPLQLVVDGLTKIVDLVGTITKPISAVLGSGMGAVGGAALLGGAALKMFGPASTLLMARYGLTSGPVSGAIAGFRAGRNGGVGDTMTDQLYNRNQLRWWQRPFYTMGMGLGSFFPRGDGEHRGLNLPGLGMRGVSVVANWQADFARESMKPYYERKPGILGGIGDLATKMKDPFTRLAEGAVEIKNAAVKLASSATQAGQTLVHYAVEAGQKLVAVLQGKPVGPTSAPPAAPPDDTSKPIPKPGPLARLGEKVTPLQNIIPQNTLNRGGINDPSTGKPMKRFTEALDNAGQRVGTFGDETARAGRSLVGMVGATSGNALRTGAQMAGGTLAWAGRGLMGAMGGPWGLALMGAFAAAQGVSSWRENDAAQRESFKTITSPAASYNDALGRSTQTLDSFTGALAKATKALPKETSIFAMSQLSSAVVELSKTQKEFTNPDLKNIDTAVGAVGWMASMGKMDPEKLQLIQADLYKKFGLKDANAITQAYLKMYSASDEASGGFTPESMRALVMEARVANQAFNPFVNMGNASEESQGIFKNIGGGIEQWAVEAGDLYGPTYGQAVEAQGLGQLFESLVRETRGSDSVWGPLSGGWVSDDAKTAFMAGLQQIEAITGDLGFNQAQLPSDMEKWSSQDIQKYLFNDLLKNGSDQAKAFRQQLIDAGIDLENIGEEDVLTKYKYSDESEYNKNLRRTGFSASYGLDNKLQRDASTEKIGNPWVQFLASTDLARKTIDYYGEKTGESFDAIGGAALTNAEVLTKSAADIRRAMSEMSPNSPEYAKYAQALSYTNQLSSYQLNNTDRQGRLQMASDNWLSILRNPDKNNQQEAREAEARFRGEQEDLENYLIGMIQTLENAQIQRKRMEADFDRQIRYQKNDFYRQMRYMEEDFQRQQRWATQDYNRGLERQAEDAADTIMDAYQGVAIAPQASAPELIANLRAQSHTIMRQAKQVKELMRRGMSLDVVEMLDLNNPQNWAQVEAAIAGFSKKEIEALNRQAQRRRSASDALTQDPNTSRARARQEEDRARSIERAQRSYDIQVDRSWDGFNRSIRRAEKAQEIALDRMAQDLRRMFKEYGDDLEDLVAKSEGFIDKLFGKKTAERLKTKIEDWQDVVDTTLAEFDATIEIQVSTESGHRYGYPARPDSASTPAPEEQTTTAEPAPGSSTYADRWHHNPYSRGESTSAVDSRPQRGAGRPRYAEGGIVTEPHYGLVGEAGPEVIVPLTQGGTQFMAQMYRQVTQELLRTTQTRQYASVASNTRVVNVNNSTTFRDITITAQDPNEMARKLKEKERLVNLRRGAAAGQS